MPTTYITYQDLYRDVVAFASRLPEFDIIAGVPRSGMIPAAMLATHLHKPLIDIFSLASGRPAVAGNRLKREQVTGVICSPSSKGKVLVVDDSIYRGASLYHVKLAIAAEPEIAERYRFTFAAIYHDPDIDPPADVDTYHRDVPGPRYFQWNLMQHPALSHAMLDIDGVLCLDPPVPDDDGPEYVHAISNAVPLHLPRVPIGTLISCRLERWREQTESWLRRHKIDFNQLILCGYPSADDRRRQLHYGRWKATAYGESKATLFIESSASQARDIAQFSGKPVICLEDSRVYQ